MSSLLRLAATDPLLSQTLDNTQPPVYVINNQEEYNVKEILYMTKVQYSRSYQYKVLVKWKGYTQPTWEPLSTLTETAVLTSYEAIYGLVLPLTDTFERRGGNVTGQTRRMSQCLRHL